MADSDVIIQLPDGLSIRRYRLSDSKAISHHCNNKNIWNRLRNRMPHPYLEEHAESWTKLANDPKNFVKSGKWAIENGADGPGLPTAYAITYNDEAIGSISLDFQDDVYFRTAELGYWLGEEYWGKGVMSKAAPAFVSWGLQTFGVLVRISAECNEDNVSSAKVLQRAGLACEGRRPNMIFKNGVLKNVLLWGALRTT